MNGEMVSLIGLGAATVLLFLVCVIESKVKRRSVKNDLREAFEMGKHREQRHQRILGDGFIAQIKARRWI